jgi:hypothetical protein
MTRGSLRRTTVAVKGEATLIDLPEVAWYERAAASCGMRLYRNLLAWHLYPHDAELQGGRGEVKGRSTSGEIDFV